MPAVTVKIKGPLFTRAGPTVKKAARDAVQHLVELGEQRLDETLRPRPQGVYLAVTQRGKASTGNYRRNVHGEMRGSQGVITDSGVVYGPWLEGTSSRNQTTRFKGYASFRKTGDWLNKQAKKVLPKFVGRAVRKLNGR